MHVARQILVPFKLSVPCCDLRHVVETLGLCKMPMQPFSNSSREFRSEMANNDFRNR